MLLACSNKLKLNFIKIKIDAEIEIIDKGEVNHFLGMEIVRKDDGSMTTSQKQSILELLEKNNMLECSIQKFKKY